MSRLESIKSELSTTNAFDFLPDWKMEIKWLIEQAGKVEVLKANKQKILELIEYREYGDGEIIEMIENTLSE